MYPHDQISSIPVLLPDSDLTYIKELFRAIEKRPLVKKAEVSSNIKTGFINLFERYKQIYSLEVYNIMIKELNDAKTISELMTVVEEMVSDDTFKTRIKGSVFLQDLTILVKSVSEM